MGQQFETFRQALLTAVNDQNFIKNNTLMQNTSFKTEVNNRINALTPDLNIELGVTNVTATSGSLTADQENNQIVFAPTGFNIKLSNTDASVVAPVRTWLRTGIGGVTPTDGIRYVVTDTTKGILLLGQDGTIHSLFPGLGQQATTGYASPTSAINFTIGGTEYIAIAMGTHQIVRIYNYTTGALVTTIGTLDTPGATGTLLSNPIDLAFDTVTNYLYILCKSGMPSGAISPTGFIAQFNLTVPAAPVLVSIYAATYTTGSILSGEINTANSIYIETQKLWIANGTPVEIGYIDLTTNKCAYYLASSSIPGFPFGNVGTLRVKVDVSSNRFLYIANGAFGSVIVLNLQTNAVAKVFAFTSQITQLQIFGAYGAVIDAEPDNVIINGNPTDIIVVLDPTNKRLVIVTEQVYLASSQCVFALPPELLISPATSMIIPVRLTGYSITGNVPTDVVTVEYNAIAPPGTPVWHKMDQLTSVDPSTYFQFRMTIQLPMGYPIDNWQVQNLTIIGEQA